MDAAACSGSSGTDPVGAARPAGPCEGLSSSVLYERLGELTASGLIVGTDAGYALTPLGASLGKALGPLDAWATTWAAQTEGDAAGPATPPRSG